MGLEIISLDETTFVKKVPPYIQTYLGKELPRGVTSAMVERMRLAVDPALPVIEENGNGSGVEFEEEFTVKPWMYVAGAAGVLGLVWYFTRGRGGVTPAPTSAPEA